VVTFEEGGEVGGRVGEVASKEADAEGAEFGYVPLFARASGLIDERRRRTVTVVPEDESTRLARLRSIDMPSSPAPRTKMEVLFISNSLSPEFATLPRA